MGLQRTATQLKSTYMRLSLRGRRTKGRQGELECEREARSLGARREVECERPTIALRARIQLSPSLLFVRRSRRLHATQRFRFDFQSICLL